jgi:adenosylcobinamide-phosphate synthase
MPFDAAHWLVPGALLLDALIGDPDWLWRRWPHPVALIGNAIAACETRFNRPASSERHRRLAGVLTLAALCIFGAGVAFACHLFLSALPGGWLMEALLASLFLAQKSLVLHVRRVAEAFVTGGVTAARTAVAMIVGRDTASLDSAGISHAAIESCAENFSDGIVAPAFWLALGGLPGLVVYKIVNTADSMIGHLSPRYAAFGWAAARTDDLLNLIPARLAALMLLLTAPVLSAPFGAALRITWRDGAKHRSPNAGWPESAMAALLGLALGGPRRYGDAEVDAPLLNAEGRRAADPADIVAGIRATKLACALQIAIYTLLAAL